MATAAHLPDSQPGLVDLVRRAEAGCNESARLLHDRCREPLLLVIRRIISPALRRLVDSDDLVCETFAEIFCRHFSEEVLRSPESLWRYMAKIAENKVLDAHRKFMIYERRNILRDISLDEMHPEEWLASRDMAIDDTLCLQDFIEDWWGRFLRQQPLVYGHVIRECAAGKNVAEIAERLKLSPRHIYRIIHRVEKALRDSWMR